MCVKTQADRIRLWTDGVMYLYTKKHVTLNVVECDSETFSRVKHIERQTTSRAP